jgi:Rhodopirellula transposase DDE domain
LNLIEPQTGGDPITGKLYVRGSLAHLSASLTEVKACPATVAAVLRQHGYAPRVNVKRFTGPPHPDRDRQFNYLQEQIDQYRGARQPVISVDTKKKELIGNFKNDGAIWHRQGDPVLAHDFRQDASCRAVPYGIYDLERNHGLVVVGTSSDTPSFAVDAIVAWWRQQGQAHYAHAEEMLILADAGGSNGCRSRVFKQQLHEQLAQRYGLVVTVGHYPAGASKWNPIEHRLFAPISTNWAGKPLRTLKTMLACLRGTRTTTGLRVTARLNERRYQTGVKVPNGEMESIDIVPHGICPCWNYTIFP